MPNADIRIPTDYFQFQETIEKIFNVERYINPTFHGYYAYLTVDQFPIRAGQSYRVNGLHVDGLPRDRVNPEHQPIVHAYLVANVFPTRFFNHSFDMRPYDLQKHQFHQIFNRLGDVNEFFEAKPYEINLMNGYSVHDSHIADKDCMRTLIRVDSPCCNLIDWEIHEILVSSTIGQWYHDQYQVINMILKVLTIIMRVQAAESECMNSI